MPRTALLASIIGWTLMTPAGAPAGQNRTAPQQRSVAVAAAAAANQPVNNPANRWRYRFYNGQWWYYHPTNQWLYWTGKSWTGYRSATSGQRPAKQAGPSLNDDAYDFGRRPALSIQREKNESRGLYSNSIGTRPERTIQSQKNDSRTQWSDSLGVRPPLTIQLEKNDARAR